MTPGLELTSGRLLARNMAINVVGGALPAISVLVAVPVLVRAMGDARFGILTLAWTVVGYFSLFDLGIGRALTHAAASRIGEGRESDVPVIAWTALAMLAPVGVAGALGMYFGAPWLTAHALNVPGELRREALVAFQLLAIAIPATALTAVLRGLLEARQRFGLVNALRAPYGVISYLGPLAILPFSRSVVPAVALLTAARVALVVAHFIACARVVPGFSTVRLDRAASRPLLGFGGWMTLSNVVSPLMNTVDRFVVGMTLTMTAVSYYASPHELVTKMWLFTAAVHPVFFPAFATSVTFDRTRTARLFDRCLRMTFAGLLLPTLLLVLLAPEILRVWLGPTFVEPGTGVLRLLALAVFVNTLGQAAMTLVQSLGRPDLTGKFHLLELPLYALLLWYLLPRYGITGVAAAWGIRAVIDAGLLLAASGHVLPEARHAVGRVTRWLVAAMIVVASAALVSPLAARTLLAVVAAAAWAPIVWWRVLTPEERAAPTRALRLATPGD